MIKDEALIPISVDNKEFTTKFFTEAIKQLIPKYKRLTFLIADELQLYNKASIVPEQFTLNALITKFRDNNRYVVERAKWLKRVQLAFGRDGADVEWNTMSIEDFTDRDFYRIYRNLLLASVVVPEFQEDIRASASEHAEKHGSNGLVRQRLSALYIIEELALNLRIRLFQGIEEEFYAFGYPLPFEGLYSGRYGIDIFSLCGVKPNGKRFSFYTWDAERHSWRWSFGTPGSGSKGDGLRF